MICSRSVLYIIHNEVVIDNFIDFLRRENIEFNLTEDVSEKSYIKIGATVKTVTPKNKNELVLVLSNLCKRELQFKVIGKLTNLLITGRFDGFVIKTDKINTYFRAENKIYAECGARFMSVCQYARQNSMGGFEELMAIPGSVGGMIFSNAGAYGKVISDITYSYEIYDTETDKILTLYKDEMSFSYRDSILKHRPYILLSCIFVLPVSEPERVTAMLEYYRQKRIESQPYGMCSLGSVFKRPPGYFAGELIEKADLKGYRVGGAEVSSKHAGFIVNTGNATAEDFISLKDYIKKCVFERFGVLLEEEIEILT